ncbi:MAG: hypothetical protein ACI8QF_000599, partial [Limisphaerales bacterium]
QCSLENTGPDKPPGWIDRLWRSLFGLHELPPLISMLGAFIPAEPDQDSIRP